MADSAQATDVRWVDPAWRGILPLDTFHVPRRLRRTVRRQQFDIRVDSAFETVMRLCAEPTPNRPKTWINNGILEAYVALHRQGGAHSVEAWRDGRLVGGLYGVSIGAAFFGESMFSRATAASKGALVHLVARLRAGGYRLLDAQFGNNHLIQFGVLEIPRTEYHRLLDAALRHEADFLAHDPEAALEGLLSVPCANDET